LGRQNWHLTESDLGPNQQLLPILSQGKNGGKCAESMSSMEKRSNMAQLAVSEAVTLKNILVATDFSVASASALAYVIPIAREYHSVVHVLHIVRPSEIDHALTEDEDDISQEIPVDAQHQLTLLEGLLDTVPHKIWTREGNIATAVRDLVDSEHIDLIVVRGKRRIGF